jgi:AraC-like DNA-binding protein
MTSADVLPPVIGSRNYAGTIQTDFVAEKILSRQLNCPGASAVAHDISAIKGHSLTRIRNLQLHFSWNMGYVGGIARAGAKTMLYDSRPRYLYVVSSPLEIEFEMERSSFRELAVEYDRPFLLRCCESADRAIFEIPDEWDYDDPLCWELAGVIQKECMAGTPRGLLYAETSLTLLALHFIRNSGMRHRVPRFGERGGLSPSVLRRCCDYMTQHLNEDISLLDLAVMVGLSPGHLASAFKKSMGIPPHTWLWRKRMEKAKELLRNQRLDIPTIATSVGYGNPSAFGVAFRRLTGRAPSVWRRNI